MDMPKISAVSVWLMKRYLSLVSITKKLYPKPKIIAPPHGVFALPRRTMSTSVAALGFCRNAEKKALSQRHLRARSFVRVKVLRKALESCVCKIMLAKNPVFSSNRLRQE